MTRWDLFQPSGREVQGGGCVDRPFPWQWQNPRPWLPRAQAIGLQGQQHRTQLLCYASWNVPLFKYRVNWLYFVLTDSNFRFLLACFLVNRPQTLQLSTRQSPQLSWNNTSTLEFKASYSCCCNQRFPCHAKLMMITTEGVAHEHYSKSILNQNFYIEFLSNRNEKRHIQLAEAQRQNISNHAYLWLNLWPNETQSLSINTYNEKDKKEHAMISACIFKASRKKIWS